jgi:hypothetical protein
MLALQSRLLRRTIMHAVAATVAIAPGSFEGARTGLQTQVVPRMKQAPGFVKGYWTINASRDRGTSMMLFDTQENALNAAKMARSAQPPPSGVTLTSVEVYEVIAEA